MPPKRWSNPPTFNSVELHKNELLRYIKTEIENNNFLGLVGEELNNMANMLTTCTSRREVYDWCQTLMIGESIAAEIIKRRVNKGPFFDDTPACSNTSPSLAEAADIVCTNSVTGKSNNNNNTGDGGSRFLDLSSKRSRRKKTIMQGKNKDNSAIALKPGYFECGCFAMKHKFRGNCANCGRIICEQESDKTCYYCGLDPAVCVAYEIKIQDGLLSEAALEKNRANYEAAVAKRNELLHYAETRAKRTEVIDDQTAVFLSPQHAWMSVQERDKANEDEALAERRRKVAAMHTSSGAYKAHLNIVNDNVSLGCTRMPSTPPSDASSCTSRALSHSSLLEVEEVRAVPLPSLIQKIWYSKDGDAGAGNTSTFTPAENETKGPNTGRVIKVSQRVQQEYHEEDVQFFFQAQKEWRKAVSSHTRSDGLSENVVENEEEKNTMIHDPRMTQNQNVFKETTERNMVVDTIAHSPVFLPHMLGNDNGICLSMHQPWAGLLIAGIKSHEGRVWSTDYRGRLWIHAASARPMNIAEVEERYSRFKTSTQQFPKNYPTRVLLGYVNLTNCVDRETYEQMFTTEKRQEESPFSFICTGAKALPFPLPMEGNHKLFRLDHKVHTAARKQLMELT